MSIFKGASGGRENLKAEYILRKEKNQKNMVSWKPKEDRALGRKEWLAVSNAAEE